MLDSSPFELEPEWNVHLREELQKPYIIQLSSFVEKERLNGPVFPPKELMFNAFSKTPFSKVKVVIVGQDPYHGSGQAHGLSFSVPKGIPIPPSLKNIYKELASDLGLPIPSHGCLLSWAEQGVLLLNATLTVREKNPLSHHKKGWESFTDAVLELLVQKKESLVFLLWGKSAQEKCGYLESLDNAQSHLFLKTSHPSPFSAHQGFLGCRHFSKANAWLKKNGQIPIDWNIE